MQTVLEPHFFWPRRTTTESVKKKRELIQLLAYLYNKALKRKTLCGTGEIKVSLLSFRALVRDYQPAFNFFFEIVKRGFHISDEFNDLTTVIPKIHNQEFLSYWKYEPKERPDGIVSKVLVMEDDKLLSDLLIAGRIDLIPKVEFLLNGPGEINFIFAPSGQLHLRDTSIWPIEGIENWPSWVRSRLFGSNVDIKSAYIQFVIEQISNHYRIRSRTLFDQVFKLWEHQDKFRSELAELIGVDVEDYRKQIKQILMSIAMGSNISTVMLQNAVSFSQCVRLINEICPTLTPEQSVLIFNFLQPFTNQIRLARKTVDISMGSYLKWEKERRYLLWEFVDRHGIMMHDGLDGIPKEYIHDLQTTDFGFEIVVS